MNQMTVTAKGQVTFRKDLLEHLGVHPGDRIEVQKLANGRVEISAAGPSGPIAQVFNALRRPGQAALSIEEINDIAASGWAGLKAPER